MSRFGFSQRLELRQSQALVMTPQLQQAIKMLQLSNIELADFVEAEIEQNPLLEHGEREADDTPAAGEIDPAAVEVNRTLVELSGALPEELPGRSRRIWLATPPTTGASPRARRATVRSIAAATPSPGKAATAAATTRTCAASTRPRRVRGRCANI